MSNQRVFMAAACLLFAAMGCAGRRGSTRDGSTGHEGPSHKDGLLRPDEILSILERSKVNYELRSDRPIEPSALINLTPSRLVHPRPIDPFLTVRQPQKGELELHSVRPPEEVTEIFEAGRNAFMAKDFNAAATLFARAVELKPDYFKSYTYLGNALYFLGEMRRAEIALERAVELNPMDYQAHLFLGDTYYQQAKYHRAKASLLEAYLLNRTSEVVLDRLRTTLAKLNLKLREPRLTPRFAIRSNSGGKVIIDFDQQVGLKWLPLGACLACWTFEKQCSKRSPEKVDPLRLSMYRECLINQAATTAVRVQNAEPISDEEAQLHSAIEDGYLEAIIFWEVIAARAPIVVFLLPESSKDRVRSYIQRYVIQSRMLVQAPAVSRTDG